MNRFRLLLLFAFVSSQSPAAMNFDITNDYVTLGSPAALNMTGSMTICGWLKPTGDGYPISKYEFSATRGPAVVLNTFPFSGRFIRLGITTTGSDFITRDSVTGILPTTVPFHFAGVFDAQLKEMHVYIDGTLQDGTLTGTVPSIQISTGNTQPWRFNTQGDASGNFCGGTFEDWRIYNRALSVAEIQTLVFSRSRPLITEGLVGWWKFDEGVEGSTAGGATLLDSSGNRSTGTPTNGPTWTTSNLNYP